MSVASARRWSEEAASRQSGAEVAAGEVLRYLAELPWVPWATEHNAELEWQELDGRSVEVAARGDGRRLAVTLEFDAAGDIVRAGCHARPPQVGRTSVLTPWGGEFGDYRTLGGMRIPTCARARPGPIRLLERRGDLGRGARPAVWRLISEWRDRHRPGVRRSYGYMARADPDVRWPSLHGRGDGRGKVTRAVPCRR